ncbi:MAG: SRPBCC domain-containing protein [Myxococcaceae bacterium]
MSKVPPIIKELTLNASPEKVFDAYTVKSELEKWFAHEATIDPTADGAWRYTWPGGMAAEGRILEAQRPNRLVWTWEKSITVNAVFESNVVNTYTFEAFEGGTRMRIEESNHETQQGRDMSEGGIDQMISTLRAFVENGTAVDWSRMPVP